MFLTKYFVKFLHNCFSQKLWSKIVQYLRQGLVKIVKKHCFNYVKVLKKSKTVDFRHKKALQYNGGDFWHILIGVPGGFLMIFLGNNIKLCFYLKKTFFDALAVIFVGHLPKKTKSVFLTYCIRWSGVWCKRSHPIH